MSHAHIFDLLGREKAELDLLNRAQRRAGVVEVEIRHVRGCCVELKVAMKESCRVHEQRTSLSWTSSEKSVIDPQ